MYFKAGDAVVVVNDAGVKSIKKGHKYGVTDVKNKRGAVSLVKLEGIGNWFDAKRFEYQYEIGDKVYIIKKSSVDHIDEMDVFVNDGVEHTITAAGNRDCFFVDNNFYWHVSSFSRIPGKIKKVEEKENPPKYEPFTIGNKLWGKVKGKGYIGLSSFAVRGEDGRYHDYVGAPCHARMGCWGVGRIAEVVYGWRYDLHNVMKGEKAEEMELFADYILNKSPWAPAFITKDVVKARDHDIYMNVDVNRNLMIAAMVALRTAQEKKGRIEMFSLLHKAGFHPHACFLLACAFHKRDDESFSRVELTGSHDCITESSSFAGIVYAFKNGKLTVEVDTQPYRTNSNGTYVVCAVLAKVGNPSLRDWLFQNTEYQKVGEGWRAKTVYTKEAIFETAKKLSDIFNQ